MALNEQPGFLTAAHASTWSTNLSGTLLITQTLPEASISVSLPEVVSHIS